MEAARLERRLADSTLSSRARSSPRADRGGGAERALPHRAARRAEAGIALDRISGGRHSLASVSEDLRVRVFSEEKNAFVDPVELSGGAAEQVLLALRLAQAQVMLESRGLAAPHFLFFDEPLAGLDRAHTASFLDLLRESAGTFGQVILVVTDREIAAGLDFPWWIGPGPTRPRARCARGLPAAARERAPNERAPVQ
jgi:ABC-type taurine transport system ATPase subunit